MIDFRYHIVSLISVFLALAVGISLGAGPLKETIGDTLTGQVAQLRADKDTLRANLDSAKLVEANQGAYIVAAAPRMLGGALADRRVAIVTLGPVDDAVVAAVATELGSAGATVSAQVAVTDAWTDPTLQSFRQALGGKIVTYLKPAPATSAGPQVELAEGLVQGLTGADPAAPDKPSQSATTLLDLLSHSDSKLITIAKDVSAPADAVVILTSSDLKKTATTPPSDDVIAAQTAIATAAQARSEGVVVGGVNSTPGDLLATILTDGDLAKNLSTVSGVSGAAGQVSIPLALNARIGKKAAAHYGFGDGETAIPERVTLAPVDHAVVRTAG